MSRGSAPRVALHAPVGSKAAVGGHWDGDLWIAEATATAREVRVCRCGALAIFTRTSTCGRWRLEQASVGYALCASLRPMRARLSSVVLDAQRTISQSFSASLRRSPAAAVALHVF
jgi:hypothetical protein